MLVNIFCAHGCGQKVGFVDVAPEFAEKAVRGYYIKGHEPAPVVTKPPLQDFAEKLDPLAPVTGAKLEELIRILRPDIEIAPKEGTVIVKAKL